MKRFLFLCGCLYLLLPLSLTAGEGGNALSAITQAVNEKKWEEAGKMFRAAIRENKDDAENYFWRGDNVDKIFRKTMALELGNYYKGLHEHEKAFLFYSELIKMDPGNVGYLASFAEVGICCGKEKDALNVYETILTLDSNNLPANIFIGNYYFFYAEKTRKKMNEEFRKIANPTRMQQAFYRDKLMVLLNTDYVKSKQHLEKVVALFPSTEAKKTLHKIETVETEILK